MQPRIAQLTAITLSMTSQRTSFKKNPKTVLTHGRFPLESCVDNYMIEIHVCHLYRPMCGIYFRGLSAKSKSNQLSYVGWLIEIVWAVNLLEVWREGLGLHSAVRNILMVCLTNSSSLEFQRRRAQAASITAPALVGFNRGCCLVWLSVSLRASWLSVVFLLVRSI